MTSSLPISSPLFNFTAEQRARTPLCEQLAFIARQTHQRLRDNRTSSPRTAVDDVFDNTARLIIIDTFIPLPDLIPLSAPPRLIAVRRSPRLREKRSLQEFATSEHRGILYAIPLYESSATRPSGWDILPADYYPGYYDDD